MAVTQALSPTSSAAPSHSFQLPEQALSLTSHQPKALHVKIKKQRRKLFWDPLFFLGEVISCRASENRVIGSPASRGVCRYSQRGVETRFRQRAGFLFGVHRLLGRGRDLRSVSFAAFFTLSESPVSQGRVPAKRVIHRPRANRLSTSPTLTGSSAVVNTIGMVFVEAYDKIGG